MLRWIALDVWTEVFNNMGDARGVFADARGGDHLGEVINFLCWRGTESSVFNQMESFTLKQYTQTLKVKERFCNCVC